MKKYAVLMIALLLVSCVTGASFKPSPEQAANANFGDYPNNYEEIVKNHYADNLFDPYSAVYTFNKPVKVRMAGGPSPFAWAACGTINAKNRFGGYVGARNFLLKIHNGVVVNDMEGRAAVDVCEALQK